MKIEKILEMLELELAKNDKEFQKKVKKSYEKFKGDPNEIFLDMPFGDWNFPKNVTSDKIK